MPKKARSRPSGKKEEVTRRSGETWLQAYLRHGVRRLSPKGFGEFAKATSKSMNSVCATANYKALTSTLGKRHADKLRGVFFLESSSAKVLHSAMSDRWINVVLYHSAADEALLSFWHEYAHSATWLPEKIVENVRAAAREDPQWRAMTPYRPQLLKRFHDQYDRIISTPGFDTGYILPDTGGLVRPLNVCPFASPNCRAVCLNSSGQSAIPNIRRDSPFWDEYNKFRASRLTDGYTLEDDLQYLYLKGTQAKYGGSLSSTQAQKRQRTHAMWLIWAKQGCIQNDYNDLIYYEALRYKAVCDKAKVPMALRLNGTSDIPVHTLRLNNARRGTKSLRGKNLVQELGRCGIVCYDYTKDYQRMKAWMKSKTWKDSDSVVRDKAPVVRGGFPSNYYLCLSWSEVNGKLALRTLQEGGNVVMVFRRSFETDKKDPLQLPTKGMGAGTKPTRIRLAQLSKDPQYREWTATVIDGDRTDLRFDDPYNVGKKNGGQVIGLVAKGEAEYAKRRYNDADRKALWRVFTHAITLEEKEGKVYAILRRNPNGAEPAENAVDAVDSDLLNQATAVVDGWAVTTTAVAT